MNIYQNRLDTFRSSQGQWPHSRSSALKIENFAKAGFFSCKKKRHNDNVKCFLCDIELSHWGTSQTPFIRHASESPSCPLVLLNYPDSNRLLTFNSSVMMKKARLQTFTTKEYWPPKNIGNVRKSRLPSTSDMVEAGFYYSPTLEHPFRIRCPYCNFNIIQPDLDINILNVHHQTKPQCPFFTDPTGRMNKRRKVSETSSEENKKASVFNSDIWGVKHTVPRIQTTFSKKRKKSRDKTSDEHLPLLTQENILTDDLFEQFDTISASSKSQKGNEKRGSNQQSSVKSKSSISSTHNEEPKQIPRTPQKITVISSPGNEVQDRSIAISPFRQARTSRPSKKLSIEPTFTSKKNSLPRERPSSSSSLTSASASASASLLSSSKKDSLPRQRPSSSSTKKDSLPKEGPNSPSNVFSNKRPFLMQSTPSQSAVPPGEFALFGGFSPIVGNGAIGTLGGSFTPLSCSSRTRTLINSDNQLKQLKRPVSPTRAEESVETVRKILYEEEVTEEEKKMTVAEFIHHTVEKQIHMIQKYGERRIQEIRDRAEELKQQIRNSPTL